MDLKALDSILGNINIFTKKTKRIDQDSNTGPLVPKSAMVAPRPPFDEKYIKILKIFDQVF